MTFSPMLGTVMSFSSPKIQSYHCLLSVCSYKSTPTQTLFGLGRSGAQRGYTTTSLFCLLSYGETPSYLNKRVVHSFSLPYVALLQNTQTNRTSPLPTVMSSWASRVTPQAPKVAAYRTNGQVRERKNKKQNYAKVKLRNEWDTLPQMEWLHHKKQNQL